MKLTRERMNIKDIIQQIRLRPEMFVGRKNLEHIYHFVNGFLYCNIMSDRASDLDMIFKTQFHGWVQDNIEREYGVELGKSRNCIFYICQVCHDEDERVEKFFELCEKFFDEVS